MLRILAGRNMRKTQQEEQGWFLASFPPSRPGLGELMKKRSVTTVVTSHWQCPHAKIDTASDTDSDTASENVTVRRIVTTRRQSPPAALPPLHFRHSAFIDQFSDCGCAYFPFTFQGSSSASYVSLSEL